MLLLFSNSSLLKFVERASSVPPAHCIALKHIKHDCSHLFERSSFILEPSVCNTRYEATFSTRFNEALVSTSYS